MIAVLNHGETEQLGRSLQYRIKSKIKRSEKRCCTLSIAAAFFTLFPCSKLIEAFHPNHPGYFSNTSSVNI